MNIGVIVSEYNPEITRGLLASCLKRLEELDVARRSVFVVRVPGAFELPIAAKALLSKKRFDALICLGCVFQGETNHHILVAQGAAIGLTQVALEYRTPVVFGVITPGTHKQALARSRGRSRNRGLEAAEAAVRMARLMKSL